MSHQSPVRGEGGYVVRLCLCHIPLLPSGLFWHFPHGWQQQFHWHFWSFPKRAIESEKVVSFHFSFLKRAIKTAKVGTLRDDNSLQSKLPMVGSLWATHSICVLIGTSNRYCNKSPFREFSNDVSGHYFPHHFLFSPPFPPPVFLLCRLLFS